jgi:hypothetical protein
MEGIVLGSEEGGVVKKRGQLFCKTAGVEPRRKHQTVHQMRRQEKRNTGTTGVTNVFTQQTQSS